MTLAQMAFEKISLLPESNIRVVLAMVDEMLRQNKKEITNKEIDEDLKRKSEAFQTILELREKSSFPPDFDYEKALEEALTEKYERFD